MKRIVSITEQIIADMNAEEKLSRHVSCLVVEDDGNDAELTSIALKKMGVEVTVVDTAEKAILLLEQAAQIARPPYDIVFVDLKLHGAMSGVDLMRRLKKKFPRVHSVIVSGHFDMPEMRDFLADRKENIGYFGMVSKPLVKMDVEEILQKHRMN